MSRESYWYDEARQRRTAVAELSPHLASEAVKFALKNLGNLNADERALFWRQMHDSITLLMKQAPDDDCKSAAGNLAKICYKLAHVSDDHP